MNRLIIVRNKNNHDDALLAIPIAKIESMEKYNKGVRISIRSRNFILVDVPLNILLCDIENKAGNLVYWIEGGL